MKIEKLNDTNLVARCLIALARAIFRRRLWFLYPQLALFVICVVYTWKNLEFDTKRSNLVGSNKRYHQIYMAFREEFPAQDDLVVVVESAMCSSRAT
jgi:predicted RND superfamily exporter protein